MKPFRSSNGTVGKGVAARGFVGKFNTFTDGCIGHGVIAYDITSAQGVNANLVVIGNLIIAQSQVSRLRDR